MVKKLMVYKDGQLSLEQIDAGYIVKFIKKIGADRRIEIIAFVFALEKISLYFAKKKNFCLF